MGGYDSSQWGTAHVEACAKERVLSPQNQSPAGGWGAGSPMAGSLGYPFLSQPIPLVQSLTQSLLTPNLCRACPISEVLGFRVLHSPLPVPRSLQTLLLFIRAVGREFFFSLEPPLFFTLPPPHASASYRCAIIEAWVEQRGLPTPGSQRQWAGETLPPFHTPSSSLIKTCL